MTRLCKTGLISNIIHVLFTDMHYGNTYHRALLTKPMELNVNFHLQHPPAKALIGYSFRCIKTLLKCRFSSGLVVREEMGGGSDRGARFPQCFFLYLNWSLKEDTTAIIIISTQKISQWQNSELKQHCGWLERTLMDYTWNSKHVENRIVAR